MPGASDPLALFDAATAAWFRATLGEPTPVQARGWAAIASGAHALLCAPTGSGKTLAAFLACIDRLAHARAPDASPGTRVVYVSPIKALAYDIEKNLAAPLAGLGLAATIAVDVRTGDTPAKERLRQRAHPGHILITTPESLYLLLAGRARDNLRAVETIIVDEIHALAPNKRGIHLALTLERLAYLVTGAGHRDPQRIGLSATQRPLTEVARYLGGDRAVTIVDAGLRPALDLGIVVPAVDMDAPPQVGPIGKDSAGGMWPHIYPRLLELVLAHRSTIVFVNSRRLAERVAQQLSELAAQRGLAPATGELVRAHHGSVARHHRLEIEGALKAGTLRAIVATSSLELGIDMGAVDLVIQVESPGAVSRGLQRIGRAGHQVGGTSRGRIVPKFRGDLLEAAVVARGMLDGDVESIRVPDSALDVLAQQIVAMVGVEPWPVGELERVIRRAASYRDLAPGALASVLDMLAGRYPSDALAELRPRLTWDRQTDVLVGRKGARLLSVVSGGTIPDRGTYAVHVGETGPRVGELDEEMVAESRPGETFVLGATTWRIQAITRDRVVVSPAPGEPGKMPFWRGEGPGRPVELGRALGAFCRELDARLAGDPAAAHGWLRTEYRLDDSAATNLAAYVADQRARTGTVPTDRALTIERFRDELGDVRVCLLSPFGGRVHAPWSLVLARRLEDHLGYPVHPMWTDDGIALRLAEADAQPSDDLLIPDPDTVEDTLVDELARSSVFATHFRENAARALLLPRRRPGQRTPLWQQRLRAQQLMAVALGLPQFPITLETYREVLRDVFDVPALIDVLRAIRSGAIRLEPARTDAASPFARSLVFDYVAAFLYEGDAPLAERKAQALTLDRELLRELVGGGELRDLLDPAVLADVEAELQHTAPDRRARDVDELHDRLRQLGELSRAELAARAAPGLDVDASVAALTAAGRADTIVLAGQPFVIDADDRARYAALADPAASADAVSSLAARHARTRAPFTAGELAARWGVPLDIAGAGLAALVARGELVRGALRPGGRDVDYCDAEVVRRLRRRTLARLRAQVAPVAPARFAAFLPRWHGLDAPRRGVGALRDAIERLEGVALPIRALEARILPARIADYHPRMLDELGAAGELCWIGAGTLGARDGRVILVRRDRARALAPAARELAERTPVHDAIEAHLRATGASFVVAIAQAAGGASGADVTAALWDLIWAGVVTNDTFAPLRSYGAAPNRRAGPHAGFGGRWSLVEALGPAPAATARAHALATALLARWGIASPAGARADELPGGFGAVADVLRAMEDAGTIRRGYFVDGTGGSQYAWPAAIDRLREDRPGRAPRVDTLATVDPACAWGSALAWPELADGSVHPARRVGTTIVQVDGELALYLESQGARVATGRVADDTIALALAVGLPALAAQRRRRELLVETIDGAPALGSRWRDALIAAGGRVDYRGIVLGSLLPGSAPPAPEDDPEG